MKNNYIYQENDKIPKLIILAQELQKARDYDSSIELYSEFFERISKHPLRFKALFEITDNQFHKKEYKIAKIKYENFLEYCSLYKPFIIKTI